MEEQSGVPLVSNAFNHLTFPSSTEAYLQSAANVLLHVQLHPQLSWELPAPQSILFYFLNGHGAWLTRICTAVDIVCLMVSAADDPKKGRHVNEISALHLDRTSQ